MIVFMGIEELRAAATGRTRPWLIVSITALGWSLLTIVILHVISSHNPVLDTLSSYAFTDRGTGMLAASILSLSVGSLALLGALISAGVPVSRTTIALFGTWSLGLALAAVFPASYPQNPDPLSGDIHQYSCIIAFLSLPGIGISLLDRLREVPALERDRGALTRLTLISGGSLLLFGASYILAALRNVPVVAELAIALPVGFAQRVALLADIVLLAYLVVLAARVAASQHAGRFPWKQQNMSWQTAGAPTVEPLAPKISTSQLDHLVSGENREISLSQRATLPDQTKLSQRTILSQRAIMNPSTKSDPSRHKRTTAS